MDNKDKYQLFKDIYLELLRCELSNLLKNNDEISYHSVADVNTEKLHKIVFSRAFALTAFVVNDAKETKIIS